MNSRKKINIILDTDPGVDDALAMFFLSQRKKINISLVVATAGNKGLDVTSKNSAYLMNRFKINCPLVLGRDAPIHRAFKDAGAIHGQNGLGNFVFDKPANIIISKDLETEMKKALDSQNETIYVCLGPMTNLAYFLANNPKYKTKISKIVFMGGVKDAVIEGSVYKEFNVGVDPEAVEAVLKTKIPFVVVPCDLGHIAYLTSKDLQKIQKFGKLGKDFKMMFANYQDPYVPKNCIATHDSCAALYITNGNIFKEIEARAKVKYYSEIGTGCLTTQIHSKQKKNASLVVDIDVKKFKKLIFKKLKAFKE